MQRIVWLTDPHLDFIDPPRWREFLSEINGHQPDAILLGGDIGESQTFEHWLQRFDDELSMPLYFVLGNHDYYHGSIREVRRRASQLSRERDRLTYLNLAEFAQLSPRVGLVGHDGWADGRLGDYERSYVMMNDYRLIAELANTSKRDRWPQLMALGDEAADHFRRVLPAALAVYQEVILLTHVPPWREACWYEGKISNDEWAPHFTCKAAGDAILDIMQRRPQHKLTVLCGHTHSPGETQLRDNVRVLTGGAEYGTPRVTGVFELS